VLVIVTVIWWTPRTPGRNQPIQFGAYDCSVADRREQRHGDVRSARPRWPYLTAPVTLPTAPIDVDPDDEGRRFAAFVVVWFHEPVKLAVVPVNVEVLTASNRICGLADFRAMAIVAHCCATLVAVHRPSSRLFAPVRELPAPENAGPALVRLYVFRLAAARRSSATLPL